MRDSIRAHAEMAMRNNFNDTDVVAALNSLCLTKLIENQNLDEICKASRSDGAKTVNRFHKFKQEITAIPLHSVLSPNYKINKRV